jgi:hypothetical protein
MAGQGYLSVATPSTVGLWTEVTTNANITVSANSVATGTFLFPATPGGAAYLMGNYSLPVSVTVMNQSTISGAANTGLTANLGVQSCFTNSSGINVTFVGIGTGGNVNSGTRLLFVMNQGV